MLNRNSINPLMTLVVLFTAAAVYATELQLPPGLAYDAPDYNALVFEEYYGSAAGRDGIGSLDTGTANVVIRPNDLKIYCTAGTAAYLPLPVSVYSDDLTIDIGLADWYTTNAPGTWSVYWTFESAVGTKFEYLIRPDGSSGARGGLSLLSAPPNTPHVIRFAARNSADPNDAFYVDDATASSKPSPFYNATSNRWGIHTAPDPANSVIHLAWVKIYKGTAQMAPPLTPIQKYCGGLGTVYNRADILGPQGYPDCYVDLIDLAALANDWLQCTDPANPQLCQ